MSVTSFDCFLSIVAFDQSLASVKKNVAALVVSLSDIENQELQAKASIVQLHNDLRDRKKSAAALELELTVKQQEIAKKRSQSEMINQAREYASLEGEIARKQQEAEQLEEQIFSVWQSIEENEQSIESREQALKDIVSALVVRGTKIREQIRQGEAALERAQAERSEKFSCMTNELLQLYELRRSQNIAPVAVAVENGTCSWCGNVVPSGDLGALKRHVVLPCQGCRRLLYIQ